MTENFEFSIANISKVNGNTQSDKDYIKFFVETAERRSDEALKKLKAIRNAEHVLNKDSLALAEGHMVEIFAMSEAIQALLEWLKTKPELLAEYKDRIRKIKQNNSEGSSSLTTLYRWFDLRPPMYK
jgi:DNA repair ATPase RecN